MRLLKTLAAISLLCYNVAAQCPCADQTAKAVPCKSATDYQCLCSSNYVFDLETCFQSNASSCSKTDQQSLIKAFYDGCPSNSQKEPTTTNPSSSITTTTSGTSTSPTSSVTSSTSPSKSSTTPTSTNASPQETDPAAAMAAMKRKLTKYKIIGGVVGGVLGLIIISLAISIFFLVRHFRQKMIEEKKRSEEEAAHFIQEGFRNPSPANIEQRNYSLQRPLSYALGEYNSMEYEGPSAENLSLLGPKHAKQSSIPSSRSDMSGSRSPRGRPVSSVPSMAETPISRKPVGAGLSVNVPTSPILDDTASMNVHYSGTPTHERHNWESRPTSPAQHPFH